MVTTAGSPLAGKALKVPEPCAGNWKSCMPLNINYGWINWHARFLGGVKNQVSDTMSLYKIVLQEFTALVNPKANQRAIERNH
ncbi:hypothetical protein [Anaerophaga thermohalophila]|uniref:hypothetical protein n=1 Tax=Anaerophaga thermohalophila TaxID=177400 RepID=UPI001146BC16|nr:hypothetical protein [Anaerophaga thermohalophila]